MLEYCWAFPFYCFPLFLCIVYLRRLSYLSLLFSGTLHSVEHNFPFPLCLSLLFSAIWKANMGKKWKQWQIFWGGGSKITVDGDWSHEIKRRLLLGRKAMTNLDSILKSRGVTLPTKANLVKAMVFSVVMYRCESWKIKKSEGRRIDALGLCCWRLLRVPWTARGSNQSILKGINPEFSSEGLML